MKKEESSILEQTNVCHSICDISFRTNLSYSGILVRNDTVKDRLKQRLRGSVIMSSLAFLRQHFT